MVDHAVHWMVHLSCPPETVGTSTACPKASPRCQNPLRYSIHCAFILILWPWEKRSMQASSV